MKKTENILGVSHGANSCRGLVPQVMKELRGQVCTIQELSVAEPLEPQEQKEQ